MRRRCDAIVVGAGPAGLAVAACLKARGLDPAILEKADAVGTVWRRHYDRLHLHTDRARSGLPGLPMPAAFGRYPSRAQVVSYLESYAQTFGLAPVFNTPVRSLAREDPLWRAETDGGAWEAPIAVIATGLADFPHVPNWPGMESFQGLVLHSSRYRNPAPFTGQRVLVIGYGNSGGEIALDLAEAGIRTAMAVRSPVNVIPREMLGRPILAWSLASRFLRPRLADAVNAPMLRLAVGSIEKLGLRRAPKGPLQSVAEDGRVPLIDIGTLDAIREGRIELRGDVAGFTPQGVAFKDAPPEAFDTVILATGFRPDLRGLLPTARNVLGAEGAPLVSGGPTAEPGLFFCGATPSALGQLRQIGIDAANIADAVAPRKARAA